MCKLPPRGWKCQLPEGHEGACPTYAKFWRHPIIWLRESRLVYK
jgi:hypothetical protein